MSSARLSKSELSVLEKGLNFCPTSKEPNRIKLLDDLYFFCRKLRLKEYFYSSESDNTDVESTNEDDVERCHLSTRKANPFYNPSKAPSDPLKTYMSAVKKEVTQLLKRGNTQRSNLTNEEREALKDLSSNEKITVKPADKGGKVVVMDTDAYTAACENDLSNTNFYNQLDEDPNTSFAEEVKSRTESLLNQNMISEEESQFITSDTENPRTPLFYGLPKIHKQFDRFPPLRPIVSHVGSCTHRLSEFLDAFLKFQARLVPSFIRDTKQFLQKIEEIKKQNIPKQSILVTMDVSSLYTNIDHEEGAQACFKALEKRKNKKVPSEILKSLILLVLKSNAFRFGHKIFKQIMGTAMGTPMAPNYANLFMAEYETNLIEEYHSKTGIKPLVWFRYIDDIFFIWTDGPEELAEFIKFAQDFSNKKKMKSSIRFEVNQSNDSVNFLDVEVRFDGTAISTSLYTKPTDAHMYLNTTSNHPRHVIRNIPKGQFIRIRRICSNLADFNHHSAVLSKFLVNRGYDSKELADTAKIVSKMNRSELLKDKERTKKDPQTIFVAEWHPSLARLPSLLKKHYHLLNSDPATEKIFPVEPTVAFRRPRSLRNQLVRSDIIPRKSDTRRQTEKCGKSCRICSSLKSSAAITNNKKPRATSKINDFGNCKSKELVYAVSCKKCDLLYVGQTGEALQTRMSKHRYDCRKRPGNCALAQHFFDAKDHDPEKDMQIYVLQTGLSTEAVREHHEDRWICRLQTMEPTGINKERHQYGHDMYGSFTKSI